MIRNRQKVKLEYQKDMMNLRRSKNMILETLLSCKKEVLLGRSRHIQKAISDRRFFVFITNDFYDATCFLSF